MVKPTKILGKKILNQSTSFNFYKEQLEIMDERIKKLEAISDSNAVLFNTILTDYKLMPNQLTKQLHELGQELLLVVDNVCNKYGLEYWIDYGTLLGAVRHSGFIPFDDDLDLGMKRGDYLKFAKHMMYEIEGNGLANDLMLKYKIRKYADINVGGKFLDKNATPGGGFLQIFYFNHEPERIALQGLDIFPYDFIKNTAKGLTRKYNKFRHQFYRESMVMDYDDALANYYKALDLSFEEEKHLIQGIDGSFGGRNGKYPLMLFKTEDMFPLKKMRFENIDVSTPNDADKHLKMIYKDYLKLPKLVDNHGRMDKIKQYPNINDAYANAILKLKEFNETFE